MGEQPIAALVADHEAWRRRCINLIASENVLSPAVRAQLATDLAGRYGDYTGRDTAARRYFGNAYVRQIEERTASLACRLFGARHVELRALSGHVAGAGVLMGLCRPGDVVLELGSDGGSHRMAARLAESPMIDLQVRFLPFDTARWNVDVEAAAALIAEVQPRMVILGSSAFLFPHPVRAIAEAVHAVEGAVLAYDASHVFGLIAAGAFQDPLAEGADVVFGSTHKTLPGPQGGLILSDDERIITAVSGSIYPALVTNHHLTRVAALGLALQELQLWGADYVAATVVNARRLGAELAARGLPVAGAHDGYTRSHTLLAGTGAWAQEGADEAGHLLEAAGLIVSGARLPRELGRLGVRLGTQEITRLGAPEEAMPELADLLVAVITRRVTPEEIAPRREAWVARYLGPCRYTWPADEQLEPASALPKELDPASAPSTQHSALPKGDG